MLLMLVDAISFSMTSQHSGQQTPGTELKIFGYENKISVASPAEVTKEIQYINIKNYDPVKTTKKRTS